MRLQLFRCWLQTDGDTRIYFTGGATAVLYGWRASTIDVDLKIVPDRDLAITSFCRRSDRRGRSRVA
jgi:hypothetical protein